VNIRCVCGNETIISPGGNPGYILRDDKWFDKKSNQLRCPKCNNTELPLELIDASGPIKVQVVPGRTIAKKGFWS